MALDAMPVLGYIGGGFFKFSDQVQVSSRVLRPVFKDVWDERSASGEKALAASGLFPRFTCARARRPQAQGCSRIMPSQDVRGEGGRMKQRRLTIAAIACGVLCAACVAMFLWSVQGEADAARAEVLARYGGEQVEACVATRDIAAGERLDASAVEAKLWVADLLPEDAVSNSAIVVGRTATTSIFKGEVIVEKRFQEGQGALDIPLGMQAVSVPTKAVQAVGGAIRPGMSVDVYSSGSSGTVALARGVIVLATSVGESGSLVSNDVGWITLAVAPERVEEIISASGKTSLYFALPGEDPVTSGEEASGAADRKAGGNASDAAQGLSASDEKSKSAEAGGGSSSEAGSEPKESAPKSSGEGGE